MNATSKGDCENGTRLSLFNDTSRADWFVGSRNPMVVMRMPGCYRELVNSAHSGWLRLDAKIPESPGRFLDMVQGLCGSPGGSQICYCEEAELIIALERKHCSFELCYDELE